MTHTPDRQRRHSIRLDTYDYRQVGIYFVTICTDTRICGLGEVVQAEMIISNEGSIVTQCWQMLPSFFKNATLDEFVVMPNHIHGLLAITADEQIVLPDQSHQRKHGTLSGSLGAIIQTFKSVSTRRVNRVKRNAGNPLWQRNYYEHIVRNDDELNRIRQYILDNPMNWETDDNNPRRL